MLANAKVGTFCHVLNQRAFLFEYKWANAKFIFEHIKSKLREFTLKEIDQCDDKSDNQNAQGTRFVNALSVKAGKFAIGNQLKIFF